MRTEKVDFLRKKHFLYVNHYHCNALINCQSRCCFHKQFQSIYSHWLCLPDSLLNLWNWNIVNLRKGKIFCLSLDFFFFFFFYSDSVDNRFCDSVSLSLPYLVTLLIPPGSFDKVEVKIKQQIQLIKIFYQQYILLQFQTVFAVHF